MALQHPVLGSGSTGSLRSYPGPVTMQSGQDCSGDPLLVRPHRGRNDACPDHLGQDRGSTLHSATVPSPSRRQRADQMAMNRSGPVVTTTPPFEPRSISDTSRKLTGFTSTPSDLD
jgi:hypothetical protein